MKAGPMSLWLLRSNTDVPVVGLVGTTGKLVGDPEAAVSFLERAVQSDPAYHDVWYVLGTAHEKANHLERAKQCYWRQLDRTPGHQPASLRLRRLLAAPAANDPPRSK
jgi:predicted TPR repeat methyltransferase